MGQRAHDERCEGKGGLDMKVQGLGNKEFIKHWCPECEKIARIPMFYETGDWHYPKGKDMFCKDCDAEMEIVD